MTIRGDEIYVSCSPVEILVGVWYFSRGILGLARGAMFPACIADLMNASDMYVVQCDTLSPVMLGIAGGSMDMFVLCPAVTCG